jgi:hypothetical protein
MMRGVVVAVVVCLTGCFSKPPPPGDKLDGGGSGSDGSILIDAPNPLSCTHWGVFSTMMNPVPLGAPDGVSEPTLSSDETDLIFMTLTSPSETTRVDASLDFGQVTPLTSLIGSTVLTSAAWLSPNRLTLYVIVSGALYRVTRTTLGDDFPEPTDKLVPSGVQDATLVTDEQRMVYADSGGVLQSVTMQAGETLLAKPATVLFSPSIGDHDRTIVWSESTPVMPASSALWFGDLGDNLVTGMQTIELPQPMYYAGAILSNDGSTLYFTVASDPTSMATMYSITRSCMDGG